MKSKFSSKLSKVSLVCLLASGIYSCSKEEKTSETQGSGSAAVVASVVQPEVLNQGLFSRLPAEAVGFFSVDFKHPAYLKYKSSRWGASSDIRTALEQAKKGNEEFFAVLAKAGLDPSDKENWDKMFSTLLGFVSLEEGAQTPSGAMLISPDKSVDVNQKLASIKTAIASEDLKIEDLSLPNGKAFKISPAKNAAANKADANFAVYMGASDGLLAVSNSETTLKSVLSAPAASVAQAPALLSSAEYLKAAKSLPAAADRFATGYMDVKRLIEWKAKLPAKMQQDLKDITPENLPVTNVVFGSAMEDVPLTSVNFSYDENAKNKYAWVSALSGSSSSAIADFISDKQIAYLNLDGKLLKTLKDSAVQSAGPNAEMMKMQLQLLDGIKRIGIAVQPTAPGAASLLPIPDIAIMLETSETDKVKQQLEQLISLGVQMQGLGANWSSSQIGSVSAKSLATPIGASIYSASLNNVVVISNSDRAVKTALGQGGDKKLAASTGKRLQTALSAEQTLGQVYLNFTSLADLFESYGPMLGGMAPNAQAAEQFASKENLDAMRKLGSMVLGVKHSPGVLSFDSFYVDSVQ